MSLMSAMKQRLTGSLDAAYREMTGKFQTSRPSVNIIYIT